MTTFSRRAFFGLTAGVAAIADSAKVGAARATSPRPEFDNHRRPARRPRRSTAARIAKVQTAIAAAKGRSIPGRGGINARVFHGHPLVEVREDDRGPDPSRGQVVVVTPFFEEPSIRETLKIAAEVRPWKEDESPFDLIAGALRDHAAIERAARRGGNHAPLYRRPRGQVIGHRTRSGFRRRACPCLPDSQVSSGAGFDAGSQRRHDCSVATFARSDRSRHAPLRHLELADRGD